MLEKARSTITIRDVPPELTKKINEYVMYNCDGFYGNKNKTYIRMLEDFFSDGKSNNRYVASANDRDVYSEITEQKYLDRKLAFARAFFAITVFSSVVAIAMF